MKAIRSGSLISEKECLKVFSNFVTVAEFPNSCIVRSNDKYYNNCFFTGNVYQIEKPVYLPVYD